MWKCAFNLYNKLLLKNSMNSVRTAKRFKPFSKLLLVEHFSKKNERQRRKRQIEGGGGKERPREIQHYLVIER